MFSHTPKNTSLILPSDTNGGLNASLSFNTKIAATLELKIINSQDEVVSTYTSEISNVDMVEINNLSFPSTYLWSLEEPNQVEVQVVLRDLLDNKILDALRYQTGFREFTFENQTFYINQIPHPHFQAIRLEIEQDGRIDCRRFFKVVSKL